jgi:hypothetical protein
MLLHEQADQVTEGLVGLAFADLLSLRVLAQPCPRADLSRGLARCGQRKVPDAADRVALPSTASEVEEASRMFAKFHSIESTNLQVGRSNRPGRTTYPI